MANGDKYRHSSMIEKMGFQDEDLKCPKHDRLSLLLGDPKFCQRLIGCWDKWRSVGIDAVVLEATISKGDGKFACIAGYVDAAIRLKDYQGIILVEAKPSLNNPMETLRQLNTYSWFLTNAGGQVHNWGMLAFSILLWSPGMSKEIGEMFGSHGIYPNSSRPESLAVR